MRIAVKIVKLKKCGCDCPHHQHTPEGGWCTKVGRFTGKQAGFPAVCPLKEEI